MCLIVYKEDETSVFTNRQFKSMISRNTDGFGIMWRENGRIKVERSVGSPREKFQLWQKYRNIDTYAMHARFTTHGKTNLDNCHPYKILDIDDGDPIDLYMMHNGVLSQAPEVNKDMSDTWHFVEYILKPIAKTNLALLWDSDEFHQWIQKVIVGSKLLFMRSDDVEFPTLILNHAAGKEEGNCWLSNAHSASAYYSHNTHKKNSYNYNGGTHSKENFTQTTTSTGTTVTTKDGKEMPWEDYCKTRRDAYRESSGSALLTEMINNSEKELAELQKDDKKQTLFLPKGPSSATILHLKPNETKYLPAIANPDQQLIEIVSQLKGLSAHSVKEWVREDPDTTADVILSFYEKNTMPYELIIQQIADDKGVEGIVDIIRHIASGNLTPRAIKN